MLPQALAKLPADSHWLYSTCTTAKYHPCSCTIFVFSKTFSSVPLPRDMSECVSGWVSECLSTSWLTSIGWTVQAQQLNIIHACACIICHFVWVRVLKSSLMLLVLLCRTVLMAEVTCAGSHWGRCSSSVASGFVCHLQIFHGQRWDFCERSRGLWQQSLALMNETFLS